ncbi:kinase suppressor of Ras 2 [Onychomys torridus]|uniref:kinase suppressor of Ras 2 n=1 Tax=Onychomys torridus TaxID=38674 RepID=UPI00167F337B|nr:kinase suppressor of Ras 2 [Onychomys torridus]
MSEGRHGLVVVETVVDGTGLARSKLVKYFSRQLSCKKKVALQERNAELDGFPQLRHWFRIVDVRKEVLEEISPDQLSLEDLLEMTDEQVCETVEKYGANQEECARLNASLSCLRNVHTSGGNLSKQDWIIQWPTTEPGQDSNPVCPPESSPWIRTHLSQSPRVQSKCIQPFCHASPTPGTPVYTHVDRLTVDAYQSLCPPPPLESGHRSLPPSPRQRHVVRTPPRTPNIVTTVTPPGTPPMRRKNKLKPPGTPPPSSRKLIHLIPGFTALHRSKSHEFQLGNRVDEANTPKAKKKSKPLNLKIHSGVGSCENIPAQQRSPLLSERSLRSFFVGHAPFLPSTPPVHTEANFSANTLSVPRWSPQIPRRDLGNSIKHRFSTKYWMSQTCTVCGKGMLFGLKCKNCKLKCHNKCTKEAPPCHLLIIHRGDQKPLPKTLARVIGQMLQSEELRPLCKGRTLYSVVRDAKIVLDVNKTRQIAQEIVKGMGYLHAKGILHKDLKSKNVFYDNGKVVITDFGLFSISGVLQAGRRENKLRIQNGWLCHLAPEIIRQLSPDTEEDKLPFSKHSDVFALGTIWYELHAREWPFKTQPAEAIIWQMGAGMKPNLSQIGMGKEISDILLFCWAFEQEERPTFTKLMDMLEKLPKRNRRLSHPGHFWKSAEL